MSALMTGFPLREYRALVILALVCLGLNLLPAFRRWFDRSASRLGEWLRRRDLFTLTADEERGQRRLDLLRIALGCAASWRCLDNLPAAFYWGSDIWLPQACSTILAIAFTLGFLTPLIGLLFLIVQNLWLVPIIYVIGNLPSATLAVALLPMVVAPAGRRLSVDAWLMRGEGRIAQAIKRLYAIWGEYHPDRLALALFSSLLAYGALCLSSFVNHMQDPGWRSGLINATLYLWPVTNKYFHHLADEFYRFSPWLYVNFSRFSVYGMLVWELLLIPLVFFRRTRWLVVGWGLLFFLASMFILRLKYLAAVELVLWAMLFWHPRARHEPVAEVAPPEPLSFGWLGRAWAVSFVVLILAHVPGWPGLEHWKPAKRLERALERGIGRLPMLYGLVPVIVFDTRYEGFPYCYYLDLDGKEFHPPVEFERYKAYQWLCENRAGLDFLSIEHRPHQGRKICQILRTVQGDDTESSFSVRIFKTPSDNDFLHYRYRPSHDVELCRIQVDSSQRQIVSVEPIQEGIDVLCDRYGSGQSMAADALPMLDRFPIEAELIHMTAWRHCLGITPENDRVLIRLMKLLENGLPTLAQPEFALLSELLQREWRETGRPPVEAVPWKADLILARKYYNNVFDDSMREKTRLDMEMAEQAANLGDVVTCLKHAKRVRHAYFERCWLPARVSQKR